MVDKKIIVFGSSGHAKSIADILERLNLEIVGFIDSFKPSCQKILNYKTLGNEAILKNCKEKYGTNNIVLGLGDNLKRKKIAQKIKLINKEIVFPPIISPDAYISKYSSVGEGTIVFNNSFINIESEIGRFCVINSSSIIEHNCCIKDFCNISPGVNIGGNVKINETSFIGSSATIIQKIKIGKNVIVGAGAVVTKNLPDNVLAVGIPAVIKKNNYTNENLLS
jgi:sugar O-acyltransferase (sialic acid O-acetyltransferase NeuD family)